MPLSQAEQIELDEQWAKLWPSDRSSIESAVMVIPEGPQRDRASYDMAFRSTPMPQQYWGEI